MRREIPIEESGEYFTISVRGLVEFVLRDGNIDNRGQSNVGQAMLEGSRIHRMLQQRQGADYHAEVPLSIRVPMGAYSLLVEGRADGIIERETPPAGEQQLSLTDYLSSGQTAVGEEEKWSSAPTIDEIKGTLQDIHRLREPKQIHLAQAKCYAYFYAMREDLAGIKVRMTYCQLETEEIRYFRYQFSKHELKTFFEDLIDRYRRFSDYLYEHRMEKLASIRRVEFPYPYREGQRTLAGYVYRTIVSGRKLFLEAPTGAGKTLAVLYPALKAIGEERADRIFYMTAKTVARTAPEHAFDLLRSRGLVFRTVTLTSKERICVLDHTACDPISCPRARGHYSRVNDALYALLSGEESLDRQTIERCAESYSVCPFELSLDVSLFSDGTICDFNYVFDPFVYLRRFFAEGTKRSSLFLIDEAHNLLDRGREMYSAAITEEELLDAHRHFRSIMTTGKDSETEGVEKRITRHLAQAKAALSALLSGAADNEGTETVRLQLADIEPLVRELTGFASLMSELLDDSGRDRDETEISFYFRIFRFLTIAETLDDHYILYGERRRTDGRLLKLLCVDPSRRLSSCMDRAVSTILFSATFLPIQFYKSLLGGTAEDYEAYAATSFPASQRCILIARDVTTRYRVRGEEQYLRIAGYLREMVSAKRGKYLAFFPSYRMLRDVLRLYHAAYGHYEDTELVIQQEQMTEEGREAFLSHFAAGTSVSFDHVVQMEIEIREERSILGMCVLGGIFGEGIDLRGERLIGVAVIGTGLPQVYGEQALLRDWFDE
ncbi:MAG: DEAD/DEAH box helicase, partial [Lachnospiraceae bacterium]|nr:DEAD/DEAH box helicase [Lachnospiraceae bacterium]